MLGILLLTNLFSLCSAGLLVPRNVTACNNSPDLCSRSYDSVTHFGAHDAAFVRDATTDYTVSGNQYFNATVALSAGVRLLTAQVHLNNGEWHLCHSSCDLLDAGKLSDWLSAIKGWIDNNPNDIVTILLVNSDNASAGDLHGQFVTAGLNTYAYTPPSTTTVPTAWPTLEQLISNNTRLVTFVASLDPASNTAAPYLMDEFTFIWENPFDNSALLNFSCAPDRPSGLGDLSAAVSSGRMAFMNHFLETDGAFGVQTPDVGNITTTNAPSGGIGNLGETANTCKTAYGKAPTFILVDFFDQGPAISTVDTLNNITPIGRTSVPATNSKASTSAGSRSKNNVFKSLVDLIRSVQLGAISTSLGPRIWLGAERGRLQHGGVAVVKRTM